MAAHYNDGYNNPAFSSHTSPPRREMNTSQSGHDNLCYDDVRIRHISPPRRLTNTSQNAHENHGYDDTIIRHSSPSRRAKHVSQNVPDNLSYEDNRIRHTSPPRRIVNTSQGGHDNLSYEDNRIRHTSPPRRIVNTSQSGHNNLSYEDNRPTSPQRVTISTSDNEQDNCYEDKRSQYDRNLSPQRVIINSSQSGHDNFCYGDSKLQYDRHMSPPRRMINTSQGGHDNLCYDDNKIARNISPPRTITITCNSGHDNLCYGDDISQYDHHISSPIRIVNTSHSGHDNICYDDNKSQYDRHTSPLGRTSIQDKQCYGDPSVSPVQSRRIIYREPPVGAAAASRIVEIIPQQRLGARDSRVISSAPAHRRQGSMTSPTTSRRLLQEYSPPRTTPQQKQQQQQQEHQPRQQISVNRRHSIHVPRIPTSTYSSPRPNNQSLVVSAITSPQQTRRIPREFSPPRGAPPQHYPVTSPTTPHKYKTPVPVFNDTPRKSHQLTSSASTPQHRNQQHLSSPATTPQKGKSVPESPTKFSRLISPFSTPKKSDSATYITQPMRESVQKTPVKVGKLISPFSTPKKSDPPTIFITPKKSSTNLTARSPPMIPSPSKRSTTVYVTPETEAARHTAVVSPIYSPDPAASPSLKSSWTQMSSTGYPAPPTGTLATVGVILTVCGAVSLVLGLYLLAVEGRRYYLDFGLLSGTLSLLLGALAFRARRWQWLPNRNYVSGYIVLSMFSLLTCTGLAVMTSLRPQPGAPLADLVGGGVCGITVLTVLLAALGVVMSQCCRAPPPDNRVEHCVEGFTL